MALTWSKHGPERHYIDNCLRPCWLSPDNFRALAGLEHTFPAGGAGAGGAGAGGAGAAFGFYLV